jgi:hypothetical protein
MHRKIDIYILTMPHNLSRKVFRYFESTRMSQTLKQAKARFCEVTGEHPANVKCTWGE